MYRKRAISTARSSKEKATPEKATHPSAHGRFGRDGLHSAPIPHQPLGSAASCARVPVQPNLTGDYGFRFLTA